MKNGEMEAVVRDLVKKFNVLPNRSGDLNLIKNITNKEYSLRMVTDKGKGENSVYTEHVLFNTSYLGEMEGVVEGLIIANDYDYFGKSTINPAYRFIRKEKGKNE
jgi:hypothetical protein